MHRVHQDRKCPHAQAGHDTHSKGNASSNITDQPLRDDGRPSFGDEEFQNPSSTLNIPVSVYSNKDIAPLMKVIQNILQDPPATFKDAKAQPTTRSIVIVAPRSWIRNNLS